MTVIICAYIWKGIWHYTYPNFKKINKFRVEGYAFKCFRFFKFLLFQTLNNKKGCTFLCVRCHSLCNDEFWWSLVWWWGIFFVYAFLSSMHSCFLLFLQILWTHMSCSFLLLLQVLWILLWTFHELLVTGLVWALGYKSCVNSWCAMCILFAESKATQQTECNGPWLGLLFSIMNFSYSYKSHERYNFLPSSKLLFLSNLGNKLDVNSCVSGVCYFHLWVFPILQVLWKIWFSSFNSKLLFLLDLGNKLFVSSCEILFVNSYVSKVCYFHSWVSLKPTSLMKGMVFFL
jgi:hypothetical protein